VTAVDWTAYRKCPVCFAAIGAACISQSRVALTDSATGYDSILRDRPHSRRKLRRRAAA
jgi:hypothetical protein